MRIFARTQLCAVPRAVSIQLFEAAASTYEYLRADGHTVCTAVTAVTIP